MNYRHIYHAGNFADVLKHAVLARLVTYMQGKDKAFRVLDTHAGIGLYDLSGEEAQKTGEWVDGIGRLLEKPLPGDIAAILAPYLDAVRDLNPDGGITLYPGSPKLTRMRSRRVSATCGLGASLTNLRKAGSRRLSIISGLPPRQSSQGK